LDKLLGAAGRLAKRAPYRDLAPGTLDRDGQQSCGGQSDSRRRGSREKQQPDGRGARAFNQVDGGIDGCGCVAGWRTVGCAIITYERTYDIRVRLKISHLLGGLLGLTAWGSLRIKCVYRSYRRAL
jgi:hypothetical protein